MSGQAMVQQPPPHGNSLYPWDEWTASKEWQSVRCGTKKYPANPEAVRKQISDYARKNGFRASTRVAGNTVWFQFTTAPKTKRKA